MAVGPGKYDDACTAARLTTGADAIVLMVVQGAHGSGFSVQSHTPIGARMLATMLREVADSIEKDMQ